MRKIIDEACELGHSHILFMGDFNLPDIDWDTWSCKGESTESQEYKFIENLQDNYLYQHVKKTTRWRSSNNPNVLDLLMTNEETCWAR